MSSSQRKLLNISIVNYNTSKSVLLRAIHTALTAVRRLACFYSNASVNIFFVNNGVSNPFSFDDFSSLEPELLEAKCELQLIQGHGNVGYGSGHNLAYFASRARYHLFMNPDVELDLDALVNGVSYLEANPDVAIASPQAVDGDGNRQYLCKRYPTVMDLYLRGMMPDTNVGLLRSRLSKYVMQELTDLEPTKGVPIVSGCFMLSRSAAIDRIGGFDPSYFLYFEDFDLSIRARTEGSLAYVPDMRIKHLGGNAARKGPTHIMYFCKSGIRFFKSHGLRWL